MKIKLLTLIVSLFAFVVTADAKVYYQGKLIGDVQVNTIKGFCYDVSHNVPDTHIIQWRVIFAKTLVWLDKMHHSKKEHHLEKITKVEAKNVKDAINIIIKVLGGKFPNLTPEVALQKWVSLGRRVIVEYSEKNVTDPKTKKEEKHIKWKFELKPEKQAPINKTQKLIYQYPNENFL